MRTRVIETRLIPEGRFIAITLFGLVFTRHRELVTPSVLRHELIHCAQQLEWLYLPFFVLYLAEWLWYMIKYGSWERAYYAISFEREAYQNQNRLDYLKHRRLWANYRKS